MWESLQNVVPRFICQITVEQKTKHQGILLKSGAVPKRRKLQLGTPHPKHYMLPWMVITSVQKINGWILSDGANIGYFVVNRYNERIGLATMSSKCMSCIQSQ